MATRLSVPWWSVFSAASAPVVLLGSAAIARSMRTKSYDPVSQTISTLLTFWPLLTVSLVRPISWTRRGPLGGHRIGGIGDPADLDVLRRVARYPLGAE